MSLAVLADHMASKGRGPDSMLIHMSPREVQGLQALAENHGGSLTINPETGLPEAGFLDKLLPTIIGFGISYISGGTIDPKTAAMIVGGVETARTGDIGKGISAGLGAYGGAGIGAGMTAAGTEAIGSQAAGQSYLSSYAPPGVLEGAGVGLSADMAYNLGQAGVVDAASTQAASVAQQAAAERIAAASPFEKLTAGAKAVAENPMGYATKDNLKYLAAAAGPAIMAGANVQSKGPQTVTKPGMIRPYSFDPYGGTYTAGNPYEATPAKPAARGGLMGLAAGGIAGYGDGDDVPRQNGMAQGGMYDFAQRSEPVVRMAEGGAPPAINSVEDLYTNILGRAPDAGGLAYWQQGFGDTIDANEIASFKQAAQAELANRTAPEQQILAPNLVNTGGGAPAAASVSDLYQSILGRAPESEGAAGYWQNQFGSTIDANELAQFKTAAQAEIDARNAGTTGGIANLATTGGTSLTDAQAQVNNMYRNVLGRDADPTGLNFWSNAIASGRPAESVYQDFLTSARANTELVRADQIKNKTFTEATTPYKGYMSSDVTNIVDDWVRNTLGREPTDADKQQQWYKDAYNKMTTQGEAKGLYGQFQSYATKEATTEMANRIKSIDAELRAKGLTETDLLAQTGKTKQQLASEGLNTGLNLMGASQLAPAGSRTAYDLKAKLAALKPIPNTFGGDVVDRAITNPYGNATNPGDLTFNRDGTTTVTPNIPYRPYGGFPGMAAVKDAYTKGGGSLGYVPYAPKTIEEFEGKYNKLTGGSKQSYDYLMGKTPYDPTPSTKTGEIQKPYWESVGRFPENRKAKKYVYVDGKYQLNPDYVKPAYVLAGEKAAADKAAGLTNKDAKPTTDPGAGNDWVWNSTDSKWEAKPISTNTPVTGQNDGGGGGGDMATGGLAALTMAGGGRFSLGDYSDGGRLLRGPGDGVSDSIPATIGNKRPARLADGEFVVPARIVSELGNGSTEAGARKLYAMMDRIQKARQGTVGKGRVAKNSRSEKYLPA